MNTAFSTVEPQLLELVCGGYQVNYNIEIPESVFDPERNDIDAPLPPVTWQYNYVRLEEVTYSALIEALVDVKYSRGAQIGKASLVDGSDEKVEYAAFVENCKAIARDVIRGLVPAEDENTAEGDAVVDEEEKG
jgi:hypothetical protein